MAARAPSLDTFEQLVAARRLQDAVAEALLILRAIDAGYGRVDLVEWSSAPACITEEARHSEFATRFCAAYGALIVDREFDPGIAGFAAFAGVKRWVDTMFRVSAFGGGDHLLAPIGRSASGEEWCFEGSAPARFLMVWSPDAQFQIDPEQWLEGQREYAASAWLAMIGSRACLTRSAAAFRESLLELMAARADQWGLDPAVLPWISEPYLHCSYAGGRHKHVIKSALTEKLRGACLEASSPLWDGRAIARAWPRTANGKPIIIVTTEFFAQGHSVHRTHSRAIRVLREKFQVIGLLRADQRGPRSNDCFDEIIDYPGGDLLSATREAARRILARAPSIVFHVGVGMSPLIIALASLRLAPVQCASFGHAATTMSPVIDHFVLPGDFVGARGAFAENILALPAQAFAYEPRAGTIAPRQTRPPGPVRIAIPASLPKLNPALFDALNEIARLSKAPVAFELFPLGAAGLAHIELTQVLRERLPLAFVHPEMPHEAYVSALARCDFFLSPFPYGNMNSIIDAVGVGLPGVCLDGPEPHSHADAAIFARLGLPTELIADSARAYIQAAARLVDNPDWLAQCRVIAAAADLGARFYDGDDSLLAQALLDLKPPAI